MRVFTTLTDVLVLLMLVGVLLWCALLFTGAYSSHRNTVLLSESVLKAVREDVAQQLSGEDPELGSVAEEQLSRLEDAQKQLLDASTLSFLHQFFTVLLPTVGVALLHSINRSLRKARDAAADAEERHAGIQKHFARFVHGRNRTALLAAQCVRLHALVEIYASCEEGRRQPLRIMISDYLMDTSRQLEAVLRGGKGLEEDLFVNVAYGAVDRVHMELCRIQAEATNEAERRPLGRLVAMSAECLSALRQNGRRLIDTFNTQWAEITGDAREGGMPTERTSIG